MRKNLKSKEREKTSTRYAKYKVISLASSNFVSGELTFFFSFSAEGINIF